MLNLIVWSFCDFTDSLRLRQIEIAQCTAGGLPYCLAYCLNVNEIMFGNTNWSEFELRTLNYCLPYD